MSKFQIGFIVDSKRLGELLEVLQPYRVEDLDMKLVAGTAKKVRNGDKPAWQAVADLTDSTPRPMVYFRQKLLASGWREGTVYNSMAKAVEAKMIVKKMVNGKAHYVKGK